MIGHRQVVNQARSTSTAGSSISAYQLAGARHCSRRGGCADAVHACLVPRRQHRSLRSSGPVKVMAIDAAQPFDFEARAKARINSDSRLKIGIVGFGTFGQFLAKRLVARGHTVIATSRSAYDEVARKMGVEFHNDLDDFCEEHPEVVLVASSILSFKEVLASLPVQRLKRNTLFVDVLSVKVFPKQLLTAELPPEIDVLCTHPMFGPDSGKGSWAGLNFMYERVRTGPGPQRQRRVDNFIKFFRDEGCTMVEMSCEEHDRQAASTQFITHTVGRVLGAMQLVPAAINTRGYEALLNLVANTNNDSFELYYGLFLYNRNATDELDRLEHALDTVKKQLFGRLHDIARQQLFPEPLAGLTPPATGAEVPAPSAAASGTDPSSATTTSGAAAVDAAAAAMALLPGLTLGEVSSRRAAVDPESLEDATRAAEQGGGFFTAAQLLRDAVANGRGGGASPRG